MAIDYTSATAVFAYGNVLSPTAGETAVMSNIVTAVSRKADQICTQNFSYQVYTNVILTPRIDVEQTFILFLPCVKVTQLDAITLRIGNNPVTQSIQFASSGYQYDIINNDFGARVYIYGLALGGIRENILRSYVSWRGGWAAQNEIPADFEFAIKRWAWFSYKQREAPFDRTAIPEMGIVTLPGTTPADVTEIMNRYTWFSK